MNTPPPDAPPPRGANSPLDRLRELGRHEWLSPRQWRRRILFWAGAIVVGLSAVLFAKAADYAFELFRRVASHGWWVPLLVTPGLFGMWLIQYSRCPR